MVKLKYKITYNLSMDSIIFDEIENSKNSGVKIKKCDLKYNKERKFFYFNNENLNYDYLIGQQILFLY